jgi:hypothetical protein
LKVGVVRGDVRALHGAPASTGALFLASQFNLLEMTGPWVTPELGVTGYADDRTQGPACAIAAGAATIYRNYFAPVDGHPGQTADRQLDALADVGAALSAATGRPVGELWRMQNGYALCAPDGLATIAGLLERSSNEERDSLRAALRIGLHSDVEVTDEEVARAERPGSPALVSQAFCSALPVAYCAPAPDSCWEPFATLVLEAAYEATMLCAALNAQRGASNVAYLTLLGGGAFGNDLRWILGALRRALTLAAGFALEVRIVTYGAPSTDLLGLLQK